MLCGFSFSVQQGHIGVVIVCSKPGQVKTCVAVGHLSVLCQPVSTQCILCYLTGMQIGRTKGFFARKST